MPFRITPDDQRAAKVLSDGSTDGAHAISDGIVIDGQSATVQLHHPLLNIDTESPVVKSVRNMLALPAKAHKHGHIDNFHALVDAATTYREISVNVEDAAQSVHEQPDEAYMAATFAGMQEAVTRKCGEMPIGCWRCERDASRPYTCAVWIRHDGARHYIVFTDASGNSTEYRIYFCPWCGKKF